MPRRLQKTRRAQTTPSRDKGPRETRAHTGAPTWPEIDVLPSAAQQARLQLVRGLLLVGENLFCKTQGVHQVGRGGRPVRAEGTRLVAFQPHTEHCPSFYSRVHGGHQGALLRGGRAGARTPHPSSTPPPKHSPPQRSPQRSKFLHMAGLREHIPSYKHPGVSGKHASRGRNTHVRGASCQVRK